jgi:distribution and morphology protein 12
MLGSMAGHGDVPNAASRCAHCVEGQVFRSRTTQSTCSAGTFDALCRSPSRDHRHLYLCVQGRPFSDTLFALLPPVVCSRHTVVTNRPAPGCRSGASTDHFATSALIRALPFFHCRCVTDMSVDIRWEAIASGPEGHELAEKVRAFIHDKFQQITLPRFISSVSVHSFDFGNDCPEIDIKDICDPLPEFYEEDDDSVGDGGPNDADAVSPATASAELEQVHLHQLQDRILQSQIRTRTSTAPSPIIPLQHQKLPTAPAPVDPARGASARGASARGASARGASARGASASAADQLASPFPRSATPGIPGGTSNLGHFHLPLGGLSGTQTPLAAVASGTPFSSNGWHNFATQHFPTHFRPSGFAQSQDDAPAADRPLASGSPTRPSTANTAQSPGDLASPLIPSSPDLLPSAFGGAEKGSDHLPYPPLRLDTAQPSDLQVVARVKYAGDVRMTLTVEILLDYPMPSFVGIPLKLSITGITFDGVAILASIKKRMHFCFLSPEDAEALIGAEGPAHEELNRSSVTATATGAEKRLGGLLQEIRVESEIGRKENGKQVLKNVSKVEKFVLEQVRRIFEEEFVFPSFWTFLV